MTNDKKIHKPYHKGKLFEQKLARLGGFQVVKESYLNALKEGWSCPKSRSLSGLADHEFRKLFSSDPDVIKERNNYIQRKIKESRGFGSVSED